MTATVNRQGQIVLRKSARDKLPVSPGDVIVVLHDQTGRIVLQKRPVARRAKSYLTPPPLPSATLERIYARPNQAWDKVEAEAVTQSRRAMKGLRLEDL